MNVNLRKPGQWCSVDGHTAWWLYHSPRWRAHAAGGEPLPWGGGGLQDCLWYFITEGKDLNQIRCGIIFSICVEGTWESGPYICNVT